MVPRRSWSILHSSYIRLCFYCGNWSNAPGLAKTSSFFRFRSYIMFYLWSISLMFFVSSQAKGIWFLLVIPSFMLNYIYPWPKPYGQVHCIVASLSLSLPLSLLFFLSLEGICLWGKEDFSKKERETRDRKKKRMTKRRERSSRKRRNMRRDNIAGSIHVIISPIAIAIFLVCPTVKIVGPRL